MGPKIDTLDNVIGQRSPHARSGLRYRKHLTAVFSEVIRLEVEAGNW